MRLFHLHRLQLHTPVSHLPTSDKVRLSYHAPTVYYHAAKGVESNARDEESSKEKVR